MDNNYYGNDIYARGTDFELIRPKVDICLVVDRSDSLRAAGVDSVFINELKKMLTALKNDPYLSEIDAFLTVVSFANAMTKNVDFVPLKDVKPDALTLTFGGQTNPGPALAYTVERAYNRYCQWKDNGEDVRCPLLFYFTDGYPGPDKHFMRDYEETAGKIKKLAEGDRLKVICFAIGRAADIELLCKMTKSPDDVIKINKEQIDRIGDFDNLCEII